MPSAMENGERSTEYSSTSLTRTTRPNHISESKTAQNAQRRAYETTDGIVRCVSMRLCFVVDSTRDRHADHVCRDSWKYLKAWKAAPKRTPAPAMLPMTIHATRSVEAIAALPIGF